MAEITGYQVLRTQQLKCALTSAGIVILFIYAVPIGLINI